MKEKKPINPILLIILIVVGVLIVGFAGYFMLVRPQGAKIKDLKKQQASAEATLAAYHQKVLAARAAPKIRVADVYRLAKAMPSKVDMPDVLLELSQLARDTGISFDSISPQPIISVGTYSVMPISVTFNGTFYDLADLLYRLRSLVNVHAGRLDATGRLFTVDTLTFGESQLKFPRIQASLTIDAYIYGSAATPSSTAAAAPTSTTTGTTGTDTTSTTTTSTTTPSSSASATGAP